MVGSEHKIVIEMLRGDYTSYWIPVAGYKLQAKNLRLCTSVVKSIKR